MVSRLSNLEDEVLAETTGLGFRDRVSHARLTWTSAVGRTSFKLEDDALVEGVGLQRSAVSRN